MKSPKRTVCLLLCAMAAGLCIPGQLRAQEQQQQKPNILFLFADDQTFASIRALGNDEVQTPNLDRLVRQGTTFTHAYNQGGYHGAICVASRTMLVSGRFVWHAKKLEARIQQPKQTAQLWPRLMKQVGYDTYFTGKWHIKARPEEVFDVVRNVRGGMPNQTPQGYNRPIEGQPDAWKPWDPQFGGFWKGGTHWSEVVRNDAVDYLAEASRSENPFFMYIAFNAPHDPRQSPQEYVDRYPLDKITVPASFQPLYPHADKIGCGKSLRDEQLAPFPRTEYAVKVNRQEYYALITHMDHQIGKILDTLEKTGQAENTYIFFTADHGLSVGHHGLIGKQNMYEHSMRVPFMVVGPGVPQDQRIDTPIYLQDVMPTTLELAGAEVPAHVQFKSLLPVLAGRRDVQYEALYGAYREDMQRMVVRDGFKLILYPAVPTALLLDLENDPQELNNLAQDPGQQARIKSLFKQLQKLQKQTGDELDLAKAFPGLN